jgi:hypothetical protein
MFYGQCWKCGERWSLGTASTCTCEPEQPQRTWVGLTLNELDDFEKSSLNRQALCCAIEAKLRSKNT